jgi:hypothetical protein
LNTMLKIMSLQEDTWGLPAAANSIRSSPFLSKLPVLHFHIHPRRSAYCVY